MTVQVPDDRLAQISDPNGKESSVGEARRMAVELARYRILVAVLVKWDRAQWFEWLERDLRSRAAAHGCGSIDANVVAEIRNHIAYATDTGEAP